jgi:hypothetical protein
MWISYMLENLVAVYEVEVIIIEGNTRLAEVPQVKPESKNTSGTAGERLGDV